MIRVRDPSDGKVRETITSGPTRPTPVLETETSGLPIGKGKAEYLARLAASREWINSWNNQRKSNVTRR